LFFGLVGVGFVLAGVQAFRGTADDTLVNGIGSIYVGVCLFVLVFGGLPTVRGLLAALLGFCLLVAGLLAIVGRWQYKRWRHAHTQES
jgi:hypothetical protein